jgi:SOS-response transcriptional repressor LexA
MAGGISLKHQPRVTNRALGYRAVQVLALVQSVIESDGRAPSYAMICSELGIATKGEVFNIVTRLERRGLLMRVGSGRVRRGGRVLRLPVQAAR